MTEREITKDWISHNKNGKTIVNTYRLYKALKDAYHIKVTDKRNFYVYGEGVYESISQSDLQGLIKAHLPDECRVSKTWEETFKEFDSDMMDIKEDDFDNDELRINFLNGIFNLKTGQLSPHTPDYVSKRQVPCNYVPDCDIYRDAQTFASYLDALAEFDEDTMTCLLEFMGCAISNVCAWRFKKMLFLVGMGNTGKTQYRELLMYLLGEDACITIELSKMQERFGTGLLYQKRLAGSGDLGYVPLDELNTIKNLTGGDRVFGEMKYQAGFQFRYNGLLLFVANRLPYFRGDRGEHVYDRFIIIDCENVIPKEKRDPHLMDKFLAEREAIVSVAIACLREAIARKHRFTESSLMREALRKYIVENNTLLTFIKDCCVFEEGVNIRRSLLHETYRKWCEVNNFRPEKLRDISTVIWEQYQIRAHKTRGNYVFEGFQLDADAVSEFDSLKMR